VVNKQTLSRFEHHKMLLENPPPHQKFDLWKKIL
jgi:hypothetical protein